MPVASASWWRSKPFPRTPCPNRAFTAPQQHQLLIAVLPGQGTNAGLDVNVSETGTWTVIVTSYQAGESGSYQLSVR